MLEFEKCLDFEKFKLSKSSYLKTIQVKKMFIFEIDQF
jgi:hypothetical protein